MFGANESYRFSLYVGHYMAAVAEELISRDFTVAAMRSCGPHEYGGYLFLDVEGEISVVASHAELPEYALHWSGVSGWSVGREDTEPFHRSAYWMKGGLLHSPADVVSFLEKCIENGNESGNEEEPVYRSPGKELHLLLQLLSQYVPRGDAAPSPSMRVLEARQQIYLHRIITALSSSEANTPIGMTFSEGEVKTIIFLLEYAKATSHKSSELTAFSESMIAAIKARLRTRTA